MINCNPGITWNPGKIGDRKHQDDDFSSSALISLLRQRPCLREQRTSPLPTGCSADLDERPTGWVVTRRTGEEGADAGPGCRVQGV